MNATDESRPGAEAADAPKRLTRSSSDKVLTGLAGGLGRYVGVDPVVFRIAFVVLSFVGGTGILLYLAGWLLVPDDSGTSEADRLLNTRNRTIALWVLAIIGIGLLIDGFDNHFGGFPFGLALVTIGFAVLWSRRSNPAGGGGSPTPPPAAPTPSGTATSPHVSLAKGTEEVAPEAPPPSVVTGLTATAPPKPRSVLVPVTLSLLAIVAGVLALAGAPVDVGIAVALLVAGVGLVVGAWRGRARGLIPVAVLLAVGLCLASVVDVPLKGGAGERAYTPVAAADVERPYRLIAGDMTVNLNLLDLESGSRSVEASVGFGKLTVVVPRTATVDVSARAGLGQVTIAGQHWEGADVDHRVVLAGQEGGRRLAVRAEVGMGEVEVIRAFA